MLYQKHISNIFLYRILLTIIGLSFLPLAKAITMDHCKNTPIQGKTYYVSTTGHDYKGNGTRLKPWKTIEFAAFKAEELSTIIVFPGEYKGAIRLKKAFNKSLLIKSEYPYLSKLTHDARILAIVGGARNITIEGFEFTHSHDKAKPLLVHIDGYGSYGTKTVSDITLKNNIFHDSYNNDLLKINNGAKNINVICNMFYNQGDSDEHIDVNSVENVNISDNIFFNDFLASKRKISNKSSSYIVVKDSNDHEDDIIGSKNINIHRNIFLNWQGSPGHGFILIGEDGKAYYEAEKINIYNNLFIGNSKKSMRSPLGIKGATNINFFNNTITGDLPSNAYAIRVNREKNNLINNNIGLYNNIWSDETGTMGQGSHETANDFSDVLINQLQDFKMDNNLIFNGSEKIPSSFYDKINPEDDLNLINANPYLPRTDNIQMPIWSQENKMFSDGSYTIRNAFIRLALYYGEAENKNAVHSNKNQSLIPLLDLLGEKRTIPHSVGALK